MAFGSPASTPMADKAAVILFSHVSNTSSITGAEKLLLHFARELTPYFDCLLVAPREGKLTRQARHYGLPVELLPIPLVYGMYTPHAGLEREIEVLQDGREFMELKAWLGQRRPVFIITSTCVHVLPAVAARSLGIPVIWKISETIVQNDYTPVSTGIIRRYSDRILSISHTAAQPFPEEAKDSIQLLPPTWDENDLMMEAWSKLRGERRRELNVKPTSPLIGYISSFIIREKGLEHFINMAVLVAKRRPDARFLVIGEPGDKPAYYNRCLKKAKLEGLTSRFRFAGYEPCIPQAYSAMDVLVVPSLVREGFGMTALEGLAFGKPVVAYDTGGLGEIMRTVDCGGWLVSPENIGALAGRVLDLLDDPAAAHALGSQARVRADSLYGPAAYRERLRLYAEDWRKRWTGTAAVQAPAVPPDPPAAPEAPAAAPGPAARPAPRRGGKRRRLKLRRSLSRRTASRKLRRSLRAHRRSRAGGRRRGSRNRRTSRLRTLRRSRAARRKGSR